MKVLFFTTAPFNPGGPGKWFFEITQQLDNRGYETHVLTWGNTKNIIHFHPRIQIITDQPFLRGKLFRSFNYLQTMILAAIALRKMINKFSFNIVHTVGVFESFGAALGKKSCPLITTIHGNYIIELKEFLKTNPHFQLFRTYYSLMEIYSIYKTEIVTIPSLWLFNELRNRIKRKRSVIIPNGITVPPYKDKYTARQTLGIENNKLVFLIITNFNSIFRFKAIKMLINAIKGMKHLDKVKFVVLGSRQCTVIDQWDKMAMAEAKGLPIEFHGFKRNVFDYLFAADALIHPSFLDNQPLSILEAMACSRPVIASKVGGIPEVITEGRGGMVVDNSIEVWIKMLDNLTEGVYDLESIGSDGKKLIEEKFSWQRVIKEFEKLYEEVKQT